jgi:Ca-activated chloride channel family protein
MKKNTIKPLILIAALFAATMAAMAYSKEVVVKPGPDQPGPVITSKRGPVRLTGKLSQTKIYSGGDGAFCLSLEMTADEITTTGLQEVRNVDLVVVLDRSGSMEGQKIEDARRAIINLLPSLGAKDRLALVSYSDHVIQHTVLLPMTDENRRYVETEARNIMSGGGTNLGAGLQTGIDALVSAAQVGNIAKIILISDGLANQGVIDPVALGNMAASAARREFSVSTLGVGLDFNEYLMTSLADRGAGQYHFLENPVAFARIFEKEFQMARASAATGVEIHVPLHSGLAVADAAGFPVENQGGLAVIRPGTLLSGQTRRIFLTMRAPTDQDRTFDVSGVNMTYTHNGVTFRSALPGSFQVACVTDQVEAYSSMDKDTWEKKVLQEDYNKLREDVARDIGAGRKEEAMARIREYAGQQATVNAVVGSEKVQSNLDNEVDDLRAMVTETFSGQADEVQMKQKVNSKQMQHEGYKTRRAY